MDIDHLRYVTGFPGVAVLLRADGRWQVQVESVCRHLDESTNRCRVHGTPEQPRTCAYFNPHRCWYRATFATDPPSGVVRIDASSFDRFARILTFDGDGRLVDIPTFEAVEAVIAGTVDG